MIEFNISSLFWMAMGGIITFLGFLVLSLCRVAGFYSRLEEYQEDILRVNNWANTPKRIAMSERKR